MDVWRWGPCVLFATYLCGILVASTDNIAILYYLASSVLSAPKWASFEFNRKKWHMICMEESAAWLSLLPWRTCPYTSSEGGKWRMLIVWLTWGLLWPWTEDFQAKRRQGKFHFQLFSRLQEAGLANLQVDGQTAKMMAIYTYTL